MFFTFSIVFWFLLWGLILIGKLVVQATRNKVYEVENTKLYKAAKARWDRLK